IEVVAAVLVLENVIAGAGAAPDALRIEPADGFAVERFEQRNLRQRLRACLWTGGVVLPGITRLASAVRRSGRSGKPTLSYRCPGYRPRRRATAAGSSPRRSPRPPRLSRRSSSVC